VVLHHLVWVKDIAPYLVAELCRDVLALKPLHLLPPPPQFPLQEAGVQDAEGDFSILQLGALALNADGDAGGLVNKAHGGAGLLHVLAPRAA